MSTMITTSYLEDNLGTVVIHAEDDDGADPTTGNDDDLQSIAAISVPDMQTDMSPQPPATATASSTVIRPPVTSFQPALSPIAAVAESPSQSSASREDGNVSKNKSYASALGGSAFSAGSNSTAAGSNSTAAGSNPHVDPLPASTASLEDTRELKDILALLDRNMEMELQMIRAKYERKRVPIVEALSARRNDVAHAQPGKAIPPSRTHQPHFS